MINVEVSKDEITPHLRKLLEQAETNSPLAAVLGRAGANVLKKHFRERNKTGNKLGGKRTNFWSRVAESVQNPRHESGGIAITISHVAMAQKVYGGTISASKRKNLAIPMHPKAHGKSPRVFSALQYGCTKAGVKLLGLKDENTGGIDWLYVLKPSVTQKRDPKALPPEADMAAELEKIGDIHLGSV